MVFKQHIRVYGDSKVFFLENVLQLLVEQIVTVYMGCILVPSQC